MEWAKFEEKLRPAYEAGAKVQFLEDKPDFPAEGAFLWSAFHDLCESRDQTMGSKPIENAEIEAWLNIHNVKDTWTRQDYYRAIRRLDSAWREAAEKGSKEVKDG